MDLKDGLFLGPGEVVHLRLHNRHAAGRYSLGLGGIKLVSHADVKGAGDHSYVLDRGVRVRWNFVVRRKLNAEGERHCLIQRSLNDGNLRARWQRRHVSPFKIRGRNKRVSLSRICWRDEKDAKSAQKSGCYCNGFHGFLLGWVSEILMTHGRLQARPASGGLNHASLRVRRAIKKIETQRHRAIASNYGQTGRVTGVPLPKSHPTPPDQRRRHVRLSKDRERSAGWQRAAQLLLAKADVGAVSRQLELALLYDGKLDVRRMASKPECTSPSASILGHLSQPETNADDPIGASLNRS